MGSITFQVVGDASVGTRTKTFTVPNDHINRLVDYCKGEFGSGLTTPQALLEWAERTMKKTKQDVLNYEHRTAHAAVPAPDPFDAT